MHHFFQVWIQKKKKKPNQDFFLIKSSRQPFYNDILLAHRLHLSPYTCEYYISYVSDARIIIYNSSLSNIIYKLYNKNRKCSKKYIRFKKESQMQYKKEVGGQVLLLSPVYSFGAMMFLDSFNLPLWPFLLGKEEPI